MYNKTIIAVITSVIGWATLVVQSAPHAINSTEWITGATMLATALGVYAVSNKA